MPTYCTAADVRAYSTHPALQIDGLTTPAVAARGAILFGDPSEGDTVTIDGTEFTFSATPGDDIFADIDELTDLINELVNVTAANDGLTVTISASVAGAAGNSITLAQDSAALALSGATLTGGSNEIGSVDNVHLNALITAAEIYIDSYAGYWDRLAGPTQARVFPRVEDAAYNAGGIPDAIKHATIAQVEFMYVNMPDVDHGIEPQASPTDASISPRAKKLMRAGYRRATGNVTLPYPVSRSLVNSYGNLEGGGGEGDIRFQNVD